MNRNQSTLFLASFTLLILILGVPGASFLDFQVYWEAGRLIEEGLSPYSLVGHWQYKYSPWIALIFGAVRSVASLEYSRLSIFTLNALAWSGWILFSFQIANAKKRLTSWSVLLLCLVFFKSILRDCQLGQINGVACLLLMPLLFLSPLKRTGIFQSLVSALAFGLSVHFKLMFLFVLPFLLLVGRWRAALLGLGGVLFFLGLPILFQSWAWTTQETLHWIKSLSTSSEILLGDRYNVSLLGFLIHGWGLSLTTARLVWFAALLFFLGFCRSLRNLPSTEIFALALGSLTIYNPLAWYYWTPLWAPALAILASKLIIQPIQKWTIALLFVIVSLWQALDSQLALHYGIPLAHFSFLILFVYFLGSSRRFPSYGN